MFKLPPLMKTGTEIREEIKMPPMPLKSALKHKQQQELKAQKEKERAANANPQNSDAGDGVETLSIGGGGDGSLMGFEDEGSVATLEKVMNGEADDESKTVAKLAEIRNKFEHQRQNIFKAKLVAMLAPIWRVVSVVPGVGFIGDKMLACWKKTPFGKPKAKKGKKKTEEPDEAAIADSIAAGEGGGEDLSALMFGAEENADAITYEEVNFEEMGLFDAFLNGYLLTAEYHAVFATIAMFTAIFLMGLIISLVQGLSLFGHAIWVVLYTLLFTIAAFAKYFSTFPESIKEDRTIFCSVLAGGMTLFVFW